jgi:hypothetical protein
MQFVALAVTYMLATGCDGWPSGSGLHVQGATPYVRCLAAAPPADGVKHVGSARIRSHEGEIRVEGLRAPVTIAAFAGPGFSDPPSAAELTALAAARPQLLMMLGGVGDTPAMARATLAAIATLPVPTLILAGGRDSREGIEAALRGLTGEAARRITDITAARAVRVGTDVFVPIGGAFDGHYALHDKACGYAESDLDARDSQLAADKSRRWLLAWQAPASTGAAAVARSEQGLDVGSAPLAEFAAKLDAAGGIFAWPHVQVLRPSAAGGQRRAALGVAEPDLQLVVPRLSGPTLERDDGSRVAPGFALLRLDDKGMTLVSTHAAQ